MRIKKCNCLFVLVLFPLLLAAQDALIWYPGGNASGSAQALSNALSDNSKTSVQTTSLSGETLSNYDYLFICLGVYSNNYILESTDGDDIDAVINYMTAGGNVYMEGGDTWAWDFPTDLQTWFGLYGEADGEADLGTLHGASCFSSLSYAYGGSQQHIDRLVPLDGAFVIFTNDDPAYACGIAYDDGYRSIGVSFEFGGLNDGDDTKSNLMSQILAFFDNGCTAGKPAPMNLQAFSDYDNATPLAWDAPPGQVALSQSQQLAPALTFSNFFKDVRRRQLNTGRIRSSDPSHSLSRTMAVGYYADSYNIYRSTSENGSYTQIASNVDRLYYRDENVSNGTTYYYYVKAVYDGQEGETSIKAMAQPSDQNSATVPWKFITPTINGFIETDEWTNAASKTITAPGASQPATLYTFNDDNYVYLAIDDPGNASFSVDDQLGLNFDENFDFSWPASNLTDEGTFWLSWNGSALDAYFRGLSGYWPLSMNWASPINADGLVTSASTTAGHVQYEARIDLSSSALNITPGEALGLYLYSLNMPDSVLTASWPTAIITAPWSDAWMAPAFYGTLQSSAMDACPSISDDENIMSLVGYDFNEFGDGRKIKMNFTALTGSGEVTVQQTNGCLTNPINDNYINCVWSISSDGGITDFSADLSIYYNDTDASILDESKLQVHWWNGSTWQYEGGDVDVAANKVTVRTNHFGDFALFERDHVKVNVNVFLEGAYEGSGVMRTTLNDESLIPLTSEYADARVLTATPDQVCDWVSVELRSTSDGAAVSQRSFLLRENGAVVESDGALADLSLPDAAHGDYYVVLSHRNHLAVMSANPITLSSATPGTIDFTGDLNAFYGNDAKLLETGVYGMYTGDANGNGQVQNDDKNDFWKILVGSSGYLSADFNLNGQVQNDDKNDFWKQNVGLGTQVP